MGEKRFTMSDRHLSEVDNDNAIADKGIPCTQRQVCKLLNEQYTKINELEHHIRELESSVDYWKEKYYNSQSQVIDEYSDNIKEDMGKLHYEVYGGYD